MPPVSDPISVGELRDRFRGTLVFPKDADYDAARTVWNAIYDRRLPAIVARCVDRDDVVTALRFGREKGLPIAVRSGGHSVGGLSTCDDGIVIDLSLMNGVTVDPNRRVAHVNGGALLSALDLAAQEHGLVCPVGVVSHAGVAGLTLGGGMGRLMRRFGMTIDHLQSVELVTADGRIVRATEDHEPDLFWGLRGAGANFGIATSFEFRLDPYDGGITHGFLIFPIERACELAGPYREYVATAPDEIQANFIFATGEEGDPPEIVGTMVVVIVVAHSGSAEQAERDLIPLRALAPLIDTVERKTYLATQTASDAAMAWGSRFYVKSLNLPDLPDAVIDRVVESFARAPEGCVFEIWPWGGAVARVPDDAMAYTGRDAGFWLCAEALWHDADRDTEQISWIRQVMGPIEPFALEGRYVNDVVETGPDLARTIYGDAKYQRLVSLKRAWDPDNVFRLNQNIVP